MVACMDQKQRRARQVARNQRRRSDRALCPVAVSAALGLRVAEVATAARRAGVVEPLTLRQVRAYRSMLAEPPQWLAEVMVSRTVSQAAAQAQREYKDLESEHRTVILHDQVCQRLLAGKPCRGEESEFIASDIAFRGMKELVRAGGDVSLLSPLDLAGLRWAGVDPENEATWFLQAGTTHG